MDNAFNRDDYLAGGTGLSPDFKSYEQLHDENIRDPLTGLFNRRHFFDQLNALGASEAVSVFYIDIDDFKKKVNDRFGHAAGDGVIINLARILQSNIQGISARLGGEEFAVALPGFAETKLLEERANQIRKDFEASFVKEGEQKVQTTISLGVAVRKSGEKIEDFLKRADQALYKAKVFKNKVVFS